LSTPDLQGNQKGSSHQSARSRNRPGHGPGSILARRRSPAGIAPHALRFTRCGARGCAARVARHEKCFACPKIARLVPKEIPMIARKIREHMPVIASCGKRIGTVDRVEGDTIKLTRSAPAAHAEHRYIPLEWIEKVEDNVRLTRTGDEAERDWLHSPHGAGVGVG
jgi:hypothetical protein